MKHEPVQHLFDRTAQSMPEQVTISSDETRISYRELQQRTDRRGKREVFYEVKADLTESDVQVLARARVKEIQPGIEIISYVNLEVDEEGNVGIPKYRVTKVLFDV